MSSVSLIRYTSMVYAVQSLFTIAIVLKAKSSVIALGCLSDSLRTFVDRQADT